MLPLRDQLPTRSPPVVTIGLIALNVAAFIWEWLTIAGGSPAPMFLRAWGLVPARFTEAPVQELVTVFTSMFLHDPSGLPLHLGGNMLFLWIFGDNVEDALGRLNFAVFYILSGCAAAFAQVAIDPGSPIPMIGASGGGVAFFAHLGGFVAGLILCRFFMMGRPRRDHDRWASWRPPPRKPPYAGQTRPGPRVGPRGPWDW